MTPLEKIEQVFEFKYPTLYLQLYDDKMLDPVKEAGNPLEADISKVKNRPTLLLFAQDFTLMDWKEIEEEAKNLRDPDDYRGPDPKHHFIPFAWTKSGHCYAFYLNDQHGDEVPIVIVHNNMDEARYLAKNLQDFIFRFLLEIVSDVDEGMPVMQGDFKENTANSWRTHKKYLTEQQQIIVEDYYNMKLHSYTDKMSSGTEMTRTGLISGKDLNAILEDEIGFDKLNKTFRYMLS